MEIFPKGPTTRYEIYQMEIFISSKTHICWLTISVEPWEAVQLFLISHKDKLDSIYTGYTICLIKWGLQCVIVTLDSAAHCMLFLPRHFLINFHCLQTSVTAELSCRQLVTNERPSSDYCSQWEAAILTPRSLSCSELHLKHLSWSVTPMQTLIITPGLAILT